MILQPGDDSHRAGQNAEGNGDRYEPQCGRDLASAAIHHVRCSIALHVAGLLTVDWPQTVAHGARLNRTRLFVANCGALACWPSRPAQMTQMGRSKSRRCVCRLQYLAACERLIREALERQRIIDASPARDGWLDSAAAV
jgi:hypothetical protein